MWHSRPVAPDPAASDPWGLRLVVAATAAALGVFVGWALALDFARLLDGAGHARWASAFLALYALLAAPAAYFGWRVAADGPRRPLRLVAVVVFGAGLTPGTLAGLVAHATSATAAVASTTAPAGTAP